MQGQGILFCNEIHPARAKILSENVERMGIKNALVTNESPERLTKVFKEYFDRILVDAPCSGEGMFRKNDAACSEWSVENVNLCGSRQDGILDCAAGMLSPGGRIVYSTCTFAPVENEGSISRFIQRHPEFHIVSVEKKPGMSEGVSKWWDNPCENLEDTIRLWPHKLHGEGHYLAVLEKDRLTEEHSGRMATERGISKKECKEYFDFCHDYLIKEPQGNLIRFGDQLYLVPEDTPSLKGLKVLRPGLHLGTLKKNRFEPSHALALALTSNQVKYSCNLSLEKDEIYGYLNGETFSWEGEKGWYLVNIENLSTGWGKLTENTMKNHYPKGLRKKLNRKKA